MATYAAFKHVELYNVGKTKKRVLRPPGGGSSDIFGADLPQTPRVVKNHMQSNIFSADNNSAVKNNGDHPRRAQKNLDSYARLFGEPDRPITPAKNHMKSSIPFGSNTEAAQQLLTNGNGHLNHHANGKSGSVSSASSSVSSSTENLKMNGSSKTAIDEACHEPTPPSSKSTTPRSGTLDIDRPCESGLGNMTARTNYSQKPDPGQGDVCVQTRQDSGNNPPNPNSLVNMKPSQTLKEPLKECDEKFSKTSTPRNPITGCGLGSDGVGGLKPKKPKDRRDGNPVTGEGYMNGANQVINKNRIPPGGYSSGLW